MTAQLNLRLLSAYRYASRIARGIVIMVAILVLLGWLLNIPQLTSILPGFATMKANAAMSFLLAGISLWRLKARFGNLSLSDESTES
jgi:hypothetical protein